MTDRSDAMGSDRGGRSPVAPGICLRCGSPLTSLGVDQFRTGGSTGKWKLLFGEWAELGEGMVELEILACQTCRQVEFRLPDGG
jgi:hypothetical protein